MKPRFDSLESRNLLSCGTVSVVNSPTGDLAIIQGTAGNDHIVVTQGENGVVKVHLNGQTTTLPDGVRYLYISGGAGNDKISNNTNLQSAIHGGAGNDVLTGGTGFDTIYGDEGTDTINADAADAVFADPDFPGEIPVIPDLGGFVVLYGTSGDDTFSIDPFDDTTTLVTVNGFSSYIIPNNYALVIDNTAGGNDTVANNTDAIQTVVLDQC